MPTFHGTDTSNNQGAGVVNIGPELVAAGGQGWSHKATEGASFRDKYWPACRQARVDVGLRYGGCYHWLTPGSSVAAQFDNFRGWVGDLWLGERIQLDIEDPSGLSDAQVFEACEKWWSVYSEERVTVYVGRYYMGHADGTYLIDRLHQRYPGVKWWWPAYQSVYPANRNPPLQPHIWQYGGGGQSWSLRTSVGVIDSNEYIADRAAMDALAGYTAVPLPPPLPPPAPPIEGSDDMATYRISYGDIPGLDGDGAIYELIGGTRRHVTADEWGQVLKGVAQNRDGTWPEYVSWQPRAAQANGWNLAGMPVYQPAGEVTLLDHKHDGTATGGVIR